MIRRSSIAWPWTSISTPSLQISNQVRREYPPWIKYKTFLEPRTKTTEKNSVPWPCARNARTVLSETRQTKLKQTSLPLGADSPPPLINILMRTRGRHLNLALFNQPLQDYM